MPAKDRGGRTLTPIRWFWLAAVIVTITDLASKAMVFHLLGGGPPPGGIYDDAHIIWILPDTFRLICHYNMGAAFGWMAGRVFVFLAATAVLVPALVMLAYHTREPGAPLWALGIIVGGALGNLYDRIFHPGVRDFLEILNPRTQASLWPVFNVADIAIVAGVAVFLVWNVTDFTKKKREAALDAYVEGEE